MKVSEEDNIFSDGNSIFKMIHEFYIVQKTDVKKYRWKSAKNLKLERKLYPEIK